MPFSYPQLFGQLWKYPVKQTWWKIGLLVRRPHSKFSLPWWHWSLWNLNKRLDKECSEYGEDNAGDELEEDPVEPDVDVVQRLICHLVRMKSQESGKLLQVVRKSAPKSQTIKLKLLQREKIGEVSLLSYQLWSERLLALQPTGNKLPGRFAEIICPYLETISQNYLLLSFAHCDKVHWATEAAVMFEIMMCNCTI